MLDQFFKDGYLVIPGVLTPKECDDLIEDLSQPLKGRTFKSDDVQVSHRMFEISQNFFDLIFKRPILGKKKVDMKVLTARLQAEGIPIFDQTKVLKPKKMSLSVDRHFEIQEWLDRHEVEDFAIIDDDKRAKSKEQRYKVTFLRQIQILD